MKQTAVEFLLRELRIEDLAKGEQLSVVLQICNEAKQMEKEQIVQAVYDAMGTNFDPNWGRAELYYNEKYGK